MLNHFVLIIHLLASRLKTAYTLKDRESKYDGGEKDRERIRRERM